MLQAVTKMSSSRGSEAVCEEDRGCNRVAQKLLLGSANPLSSFLSRSFLYEAFHRT